MNRLTYSESLYHADTLRTYVKEYVRAIVKVLKTDNNIVGLVSTGSSGAILAAAILLHRKIPKTLTHLHINKPKDGHSHNGAYSGRCLTGTYIFVDDFISMGNSLKRCIDLCNSWAYGNKPSTTVIRYAVVCFCERVCNPPTLPKNVKIITLCD
jgi:orotate phosphoribosyltransferase